MNKLISLLLLSLILTSNLWGQVCENAVNINGSEKTIPPDVICPSANNSIFTSIFCDSTLKVNGIIINIVSFKGNGYGDVFTTKVYGPFSTIEEGCSLLNSSTSTDFLSSMDNQGFEAVDINSYNWIINKIYILKTDFNSCYNGLKIKKVLPESKEIFPPSRRGEGCQDCLPKFSPPEGKYIVTAWVKEKDAPIYKVKYTNSKIEIYDGITLIDQFQPIGNIIDGWQKIEGIFQLSNTTNFQMKLVTIGNVTAYFDDIRIQPFNSSMITYVYDPLTLKLVAELDDRNYAKIYEYDEEGKLIRIKKETEKGIMTIQETRENSHK